MKASLVLTIRSISKRRHEGKTHVSTQYAPPEARAWVPGQDEFQERPPGAKTAPSQGPQAADRQQRVGVVRCQELRPGAPDPPPRGVSASLRTRCAYSRPLQH